VILQQTRVDQGLPYYERLLARFPDLDSLAEAEIEDVLTVWEGLGYYARARNLQAAARLIRERHDGQIPGRYDELLELPGIGPYTAAAVGSIAFGEPRAVVDGNVRRVLTRIFAIDSDVRGAATRRLIDEIANRLVDRGAPGDFNQAVMEVGAAICTPKQPACPDCPLAGVCAARSEGRPQAYPHRQPAAARPHRDIGVVILEDDRGRVLIRKRPPGGLLGGLWEFPGVEVSGSERPNRAAARALRSELGMDVEITEPIARIKHAFSHFRITIHAFHGRLPDGPGAPPVPEPLRWENVTKLRQLPFSRAHRRLAERLD
jgi:A/G-specific adenine glycosylase